MTVTMKLPTTTHCRRYVSRWAMCPNSCARIALIWSSGIRSRPRVKQIVRRPVAKALGAGSSFM